MKFYCCAEREINPDTFSALIMNVINADWSHVFILVEDIPLDLCIRFNLPLNTAIVYQSTIPKYCKNTLDQQLASGSVIKRKVEIKVAEPLLALGWLEGNMGKDYSLSQTLIIPYPELAIHYENGEGKGFCSEFCIRFAAVNSIDQTVFSSLNLETIDPKRCIEILESI